MSNKIQVKRGLRSKIPTLDIGEPALCTDTKEIYIGSGTGNIKIYNSSEVDLFINNISIQNFFDKIKSHKSKLIGHRGLNQIYPENTCLAIENACRLGMFGFEFDIIQSYDGEFIVMHDDSVDRTTNGTGNVEALTSTYIKGLYIDGGNGNPAFYSPLKVPVLEDILKILQRYNTIGFIELKGSKYNYDKIMSLIYKYKLESKVCLLSFNETMINEIRNRDKDVLIAFNANMTSANINKVAAWGNGIISTPVGYVTADLVKEAHSKNVGVISYSATTFTQYRQQLNLGVDLMTTDYLIEGADG